MKLRKVTGSGANVNRNAGYEFFGFGTGAVGGGLGVSPPASNFLTTPGATTTTQGTTTYAWSGFYFWCMYSTTSTARFLVDISFDGGSTWPITKVFAQPGSTTGTAPFRYHIPIQVPAGSDIRLRTCASAAGTSLTLYATFMGIIADNSGAPGYTTFAQLNIDTTNDRPSSTDVPLTGTSWTTLISSLATGYSAFLACIGDNGTTPATSQIGYVSLATGAASSEVEFFRFPFGITTTGVLTRFATSPLIEKAIASGARISAKAFANTPGTDNIRIGLYGIK